MKAVVLQFIFINSSTIDTLRGNSSATLLSYILCVILYTSIMSPRRPNRLYFKVCKFNCNKRSLDEIRQDLVIYKCSSVLIYLGCYPVA